MVSSDNWKEKFGLSTLMDDIYDEPKTVLEEFEELLSLEVLA